MADPTLGTLLSVTLLVSVLRVSMPYLLGALGGAFSERSGIINIGLEGMMLFGAFGYVLGAHAAAESGAGASWAATAGVLCGVGMGVLLGALHGVVCITWRGNQIISGLAINLVALGATRLLLRVVFGTSSNSSGVASLGAVEVFDPASAAGPLNALVHPLVLAAPVIVIAAWGLLFHTRFGLRLRTAGEHPLAAETLGIRILRYRWAGVLLSGALAGLAGVWLSGDQGRFVHEMTGGRGYIALAVMILGKWHPAGIFGGALLFGGAEALSDRLQTLGGVSLPLVGMIAPPNELVQMIPHLVTLVALASVIGKSRAPEALGRPYRPGGGA